MRERRLMDSEWKFHLGDLPGFEENLINAGVNDGPTKLGFRDSAWRTVHLPHDWAVELPFDRHANASHGYKPVGPGFPANSIGWYRKLFSLPKEDKGKRLWLEFGGVYRKCQVFLNGYRLIHHEGGYNGFRCDVTDVADCGGQNVLAVRVDASEFEGWFYEGAGIYRHVWLVKTAPLAVAPDGIFVYSRFKNQVPEGPAEIHLETELLNSQDPSAEATINWQVLAPDGQVAAEARRSERVPSWGRRNVQATVQVTSAALWSPDSPRLYKLITTLQSGRQVVDRKETEFGIRTVAFDANKGLLLNGKPYFARGVCNHQDHAGVGIALPDALQYFRVARLKEMGCNALRTAHNEPAEELVEACDRLGMLVMDETRNFGSDPQSLANLEQQVRRDRGHPSVFLWSLANEEPLQDSDADGAIAVTMRRLLRQLDPTRPCTAALYNWPTGKQYGIFAGIDVQGFNYFDQGDMDAFHKNNPGKPSIGSEEGLAQYTRGIYENTRTYLSAYEVRKPNCRHTAEESIKYYAARPWVSGVFFWTGFDYRGEATPFGWPNVSSTFGILDTCGFPKDAFYYLQSCWTDRPMVHLLPHWNWGGKQGQDMDVWAYSNCEEVELFLNGKSLGKKSLPRNSHLQWRVRYEPGVLLARGYTGGRVVAVEKVETAGAPAGIRLTPDRATIDADDEDLSIVTVAVTDEKGRVVPVASNLIRFELNGPGRIIGVGNGDPICHEPDTYVTRPALDCRALNNWRMKKVPGIRERPEVAKDFDDNRWPAVDVNKDAGPLEERGSAVFRTRISVAEEDLASRRAYLRFGMVDDEGWIYVNGQLVGESHDWRSSPQFDILKLLHRGENSIAVAVKNDGGAGGLNKGVALEFEKMPAAPKWQRSAFNGLAQVIVQAGKEAGEIKLTARADGLAPADIVVRARCPGPPHTK